MSNLIPDMGPEKSSDQTCCGGGGGGGEGLSYIPVMGPPQLVEQQAAQPVQKQAARRNSGKPKLAYMLQFPTVMKVMARIMEFGSCKYEDGNWKLGGKPDEEYLSSMLRHLVEFEHAEPYDDDSGCFHLGHAIWNLCALLELNYKDQVIDEEKFKAQCDYWLKKKEEEQNDQSPPSSG